MLKAEKVQSVCSYSGIDAIEIVKARIDLVAKKQAPLFKIILMDISMPEMDGLTAVREIKKLFELSNINASQQPYICCCTAYNEEAFK